MTTRFVAFFLLTVTMSARAEAVLDQQQDDHLCRVGASGRVDQARGSLPVRDEFRRRRYAIPERAEELKVPRPEQDQNQRRRDAVAGRADETARPRPGWDPDYRQGDGRAPRDDGAQGMTELVNLYVGMTDVTAQGLAMVPRKERTR